LNQENQADSILITGAFGFVGKTFLDYLLSLPAELQPERVGLVTHSKRVLTSEMLRSKIEFQIIEANLSEEIKLNFDSSLLVNLAADGSAHSYTKEANLLYERINLNLINWARKNRVLSVLHVSSGAGTALKQLENTNASNLKREFASTRLKIEKEWQEYSSLTGNKLSIARLYSFIGKHLAEKSQYAVTSFTKNAIEDNEIKVLGSPKTTRSYLDEQDLADWLYKGCLKVGQVGFLDIGSSKPVTMRELAEEVSLLTGAKVRYLGEDSACDYYVAQNQETLQLLNVNERISWKSSLAQFVNGWQGYNS
jgi:nucleoside-diphosphate-sugar epimerase